MNEWSWNRLQRVSRSICVLLVTAAAAVPFAVASTAHAQLVSGTVEWPDGGGDTLGDGTNSVDASWSLAGANSGYFYGWSFFGFEVAHAVGITDRNEVDDASEFTFVGSNVGPLCDASCSPTGVGEFVVFRNTNTGHYALLRIDEIDNAVLYATWWFQSDGTGDFTGEVFDPDAEYVPADYPTIQDAIDAVDDGSTIVVSPGTYNESLWLNNRSITIISEEGPFTTTIDATGLSLPAVDAWQCEAGMRISGFTITGGSHFAGSAQGGGIYAYDSTLQVDNCILTGNEAESGGGAAVTSGSYVVIENVVFQNNTAVSGGGGVYINGATAEIMKCTFTDNEVTNGSGGAMDVNFNASAFVEDSTFNANEASNRGGGAYVASSNSFATFSECIYEQNTANIGGGAAVIGGEAIFISCDFLSNVATTPGSSGGGGILVQVSPTITIDQSIFEGNQAEYGGGVLFQVYSGNAAITESEFRDNVGHSNGGGLQGLDGSGPNVSDTLFCGNTPNHTAGSWTDDGGNSFAGACQLGDLTDDGVVNVSDMLVLLGAWGDCGPKGDCPADLNDDGMVNVSDLLMLLSNWG